MDVDIGVLYFSFFIIISYFKDLKLRNKVCKYISYNFSGNLVEVLKRSIKDSFIWEVDWGWRLEYFIFYWILFYNFWIIWDIIMYYRFVVFLLSFLGIDVF